MDFKKIEGLPFGFEIMHDENLESLLFRHDKFLAHGDTLEDVFDIMCKLRVSHIDNPAST